MGMAPKCWHEISNLGSHGYNEILGITKTTPWG